MGAMLRRVYKLSEISELALDVDGDGEVTLEELAEALQVKSVVVDKDSDGEITQEERMEALRQWTGGKKSLSGLWEEYCLGNTEQAGECLLIRERMMNTLGLPKTFAVDYYFAEIFGQNLEEIVKLLPLTWLPLIPLIVIDHSVDLLRDSYQGRVQRLENDEY